MIPKSLEAESNVILWILSEGLKCPSSLIDGSPTTHGRILDKRNRLCLIIIVIIIVVILSAISLEIT